MISWFTYDAFFPVVTGGILAVVFFFLFVSSREKTMLYISLGIAVLVGCIFVCEQVIVTDRERIETIVNELAYHVRENNVDGVLSHIIRTRPDTIEKARNEMPKYFFDDCRLTGVSGFVDDPAKPGAKKITFTVVVRASILPDRTKIPGQRRIELTFEKNASGEWKVSNYKHSNPRKNIKL